MNFNGPYIVVRPESDGTCRIVHTAQKLKDARYWLQYIALPGDAVFITPLNPQYKGSGDPTYSTHLVKRGTLEHDEKKWKSQVFATKDGAQLRFSDELPAAPVEDPSKNGAHLSGTDVARLADGKPHALGLEELRQIMQLHSKTFQVVLADAAKWIDWESALVLMTHDVHIMAADPQAKWPLTVTLKPDQGKGETMNYEKEMQFIVRQKPAARC
ncbi:MAG: hypothetical protein U0136_03785 [Bdellovibrionota bacterium]